MVVLTLLAAALARDERVGVVVLPPPEHPLAGRIEAAIPAHLPEGFRLEPLDPEARAVFLAHPTCRQEPVCLQEQLPPGADVVLDPRLVTHAGLTVLDLRLLYSGALVRRRSESISASDLTRRLSRDVPEILTAMSRESRLYRMAVGGSQDAAGQLAARFPESPWLSALREQQEEGEGGD